MFMLDEADELLNRGFKDQIYDIYRSPFPRHVDQFFGLVQAPGFVSGFFPLARESLRCCALGAERLVVADEVPSSGDPSRACLRDSAARGSGDDAQVHVESLPRLGEAR